MIEISERTYQAMQQWTYDEYRTRMIFVVFCMLILAGMAIYWGSKWQKAAKGGLYGKEKKRFERICEMEDRKPEDEIRFVLKQYIEHFTRVHNIQWNDDRD